MRITIDYNLLNIVCLPIYTVYRNYNIRQTKKFIKKILKYDYDFLNERNDIVIETKKFHNDTFTKFIHITCVDKYNEYEFISTLESRKLIKIIK